VDLVLKQPWNGLPVGFRLVGVQFGQAELMIRRGLAEMPKLEEVATQQQKQAKKPK